MMKRMTFLSHFILCLAVSAAAFFAWRSGALSAVWQGDMSRMTSAIGALLVGTMLWLGWQAWIADDDPDYEVTKRDLINGAAQEWRPRATADPSFGLLAERLAVILGFVGTAIGLSLQAKALAGGSASFEALATSLFTTACGGTAAGIIAVATYSLEAGIRRARR